jgi:primosomal protein N' (replication factor Y)
MAVVRGRLDQAPIILVSATPSIETHHNVAAGRYSAFHLPRRHGGAALPTVAAVDMRATPPERGRWLSPPLVAALEETAEAGAQALLFLNRRGYAPLTLCRTCGHRLRCTDCSTCLVEHRLASELRCHHCGFVMTVPRSCPECGSEDSLVACGPGVERVAEEAESRFPESRLAVMTSDTLASPRAAARLVEDMVDHKIDLLIGTQMVTKGHHFPSLTLVGVIDADLGLAGGDLRAGERTYQLLSQVSGRAGREHRPGRVLIQTYTPEHPVMRALVAGDRAGFLAVELDSREAAGMPPFGRLAAVIVSGADERKARATADLLGRRAPRNRGVEVLGPAPAPLARLRGRYRFRLLVKGRRDINLQAFVRPWLRSVSWPHGVRIQIDIDPYSFM